MTKVTFIEPSGREIELDAKDGWSMMQVATSKGLDGIVAECGGSCACATCHCYVESGLEGLMLPSETEDQMLDYTRAPRQDNSRLSCQIKVSPSLEGLVVRFPAEQ